MSSRDFAPGTFILVWNNSLDFQFGNKGALHWHRPYIVVQHHSKGAYMLAELDRTVLMKPFTTHHLKLHHYRDNKDSIVVIEWQNHAKEDYDILDEADEDAEDYEILSLVTCKIKELCGKQSDEYWQKVHVDWKFGENEHRLTANILPNWERAIVEFDKEDSQFWNYCWDYCNVDIDDILCWKTAPVRPQLFVWKCHGDWLPAGPPEFSSKIMTANFILDIGKEFLHLGVPNIVIQRVPRQAECLCTTSFPGSVTCDFPNLDDFHGNVMTITNVDSVNSDVETCNYDVANEDAHQSYTKEMFDVSSTVVPVTE